MKNTTNAQNPLSTLKTLHRLLCNPEDWEITKDNKIIFENDFSNCGAVYFSESKQSLKSQSHQHKASIKNCDKEKNEISKHSWDEDHTFNLDEKNVVDRESRSTPRKIKETIHSLKNPNHFNKISHMLPSTSLVVLHNFLLPETASSAISV